MSPDVSYVPAQAGFGADEQFDVQRYQMNCLKFIIRSQEVDSLSMKHAQLHV